MFITCRREPPPLCIELCLCVRHVFLDALYVLEQVVELIVTPRGQGELDDFEPDHSHFNSG